ncbi:hypothetical protein ACHAWX_005107 [Stephanocyclus meneghinianus]
MILLYFSFFHQVDEFDFALNDKRIDKYLFPSPGSVTTPIQASGCVNQTITNYPPSSSSTATPASHPLVKFVSPPKRLESMAIEAHCTTNADRDML